MAIKQSSTVKAAAARNGDGKWQREKAE